MRHPARLRNICLTITAISGASILTGILLPTSTLGVNYNIGFIVGGCAVGLYSLLMGLKFAYATNAYRKLIAGEGLKAQWMVPPDLWREFAAYHATLAPANSHYVNKLELTPNPPAQGVEVILGERAVIVDGDYQPLPTRISDSSFDAIELHSGPPMFINMHIKTVYHSKSGPSRGYHALRFPVAAQAAEDAADTVAWYTQRANEFAIKRRSLAVRYPKQLRNLSLVIALLAGVASFIGFYCRNQPQLLDQNLALVLAVVGTIVLPCALVMGLIGHLILARQRKTEAQAANPSGQQV